MIRPILLVAFAMTCLVLLSCTKQSERRSAFGIAKDDEEMNDAMAEARTSIQSFITPLINPAPTQTNFSLKAKFQERDAIEHIWLSDPTYDGKQFSGTVGNNPEELSNVKFGDVVTVSIDRVSDWMYVDAGVLKGGFTIRVLRNRMSEEERKLFDQEFPYRFE